ncbi:MAG: TnpV protein [Lachnospiraceae bacterium]|nr:TnpV protein [Lachnospiraceae bacterium]
MELNYKTIGEYQIPEVRPNETPEGWIGKYGGLRKRYLKEHRSGMYTELMLSGKLKEHLLSVQEEASAMVERLTGQMAKSEGVTEELKAKDQMAWVQKMNNIRNRAEEIVNSELIYT